MGATSSTKPNPQSSMTSPRLRQPPPIHSADNKQPAILPKLTELDTTSSSKRRRKNDPSRRTVLPWTNLVHKTFWGIAFNIAGVEMMLRWNDVSGVHIIAGSSGQIMAILLAVFTTVQFLAAVSGLNAS
ncbi:hypothetical protein C8R43DRAFT_982813 [Mycena crocata]|nr:hypothetical protein C8R43DRAFT_982813 [Mycena crocata]